jgi:hypothetical protein
MDPGAHALRSLRPDDSGNTGMNSPSRGTICPSYVYQIAL